MNRLLTTDMHGKGKFRRQIANPARV